MAVKCPIKFPILHFFGILLRQNYSSTFANKTRIKYQFNKKFNSLSQKKKRYSMEETRNPFETTIGP